MMKNNFTFCLFLLASAIFLVGTLSMTAGNVYRLNSPNRNLKVEINIDKHLSYLIMHQVDTLLTKSNIDFTLHSGITLGENPVVVKREKETITEDIFTPFYRFGRFTTSCNELDLKLKGGFCILFRAYHFYATQPSEVIVKNELAEFNFNEDHAVYLPYNTNDRQPLAMAFKNIYDATTLSQTASKPTFLPVIIGYGNGVKLMLLEADLESYPDMFVESQGNEHRLKGRFAPYPATTDFYPWRQQEYVVPIVSETIFGPKPASIWPPTNTTLISPSATILNILFSTKDGMIRKAEICSQSFPNLIFPNLFHTPKTME